VRIGHHRHAPEFPRAFRYCFEDSHTLRANRQTVSRVLDIAARVDTPVHILDRRANFEIRERRMRLLAHLECGCDKSVSHLSTGTTRRSNSIRVPLTRSPTSSTSL